MGILTRSDALAMAGRAQRGDRPALGRLLRGLIFGEGFRTNAGNPNSVVTPDIMGQQLYDTTNSRWFKAKGASSSSWALMSPAVAVGLISGNGSTVAVVVGFVPDWIEVINPTEGATVARFFWTTGMSEGAAIKQDASSMGTIGGRLGFQTVTTAGSEGFLIGNTVSVATAQLRYIAHKAT